MKCANFKKIREGGMTKIVPLTYKSTVKKITSDKVPIKGTTTKKVIKKVSNKK